MAFVNHVNYFLLARSLLRFIPQALLISTMSAEINRIRARLDTLADSLDDLEVILEPLLAQSLPETVVGLETIQQAKLQVVLPYLVYDLIFSAFYACSIFHKLAVFKSRCSISKSKGH